jgi:two-component system CheB/CheR fusion protein
VPNEPEKDLEVLLEYLRDARGFDFTGYKRASLTRRIDRRMQQVGAESYSGYMGTLEANPGEFAELFDTILINVTGFLRDSEAWDYLAAEVLPLVVSERDRREPIRIWSAGTASGEEAYSLAVLLAELLGEEEFRAAVKIYATDADEAALAEARHARYPTTTVVKAFGDERAARFFEIEGANSVFRQDLRRSLIFGRHDLVQHPPISRINLLVCRNTLMYFTAEMQRRVLTNFHFALAEGGFLFLGKSEAMVSHGNLFDIVNHKHRVFRRSAHSQAGVRHVAEGRPQRAVPLVADDGPAMVRLAFEEAPVAQLVVDESGMVTAANRRARGLFGLGLDAIGRPLKDLQVSYRPLEIRSLVDEVMANRRPMAVHDVAWTTPTGEEESLDVVLHPVTDDGLVGAVVTYSQVGRNKALREELERSQRELENAYEELQSTVEELETTNEELQSTNEELETTNEELHSTNEELETMNEELQSTNEELETANSELRERGVALDEANGFMESILSSLSSAVVVLNRDMAVRSWNRMAEDLWGLRSDEVETAHFLNLDIGLPVDELRQPIRAVLNGTSEGEELVVGAVNRRGRQIDCAVKVSPLRDGEDTIGAILGMEAT